MKKLFKLMIVVLSFAIVFGVKAEGEIIIIDTSIDTETATERFVLSGDAAETRSYLTESPEEDHKAFLGKFSNLTLVPQTSGKLVTETDVINPFGVKRHVESEYIAPTFLDKNIFWQYYIGEKLQSGSDSTSAIGGVASRIGYYRPAISQPYYKITCDSDSVKVGESVNCELSVIIYSYSDDIGFTQLFIVDEGDFDITDVEQNGMFKIVNDETEQGIKYYSFQPDTTANVANSVTMSSKCITGYDEGGAVGTTYTSGNTCEGVIETKMTAKLMKFKATPKKDATENGKFTFNGGVLRIALIGNNLSPTDTVAEVYDEPYVKTLKVEGAKAAVNGDDVTKDNVKNPKTGLPSYLYLLIPVALLSVAIIVVNKFRKFKNVN